MYSVTIETPASALVVSLDEMKAYLKVDVTDDDVLIESLIKAATEIVERYIGKSLITKTYLLIGDELEEDMFLPYPPVQEVVSFKVTDDFGTVREVSQDVYLLDGVTGRLRLKEGASYPACRKYMGVEIRYKAGYGDTGDSVPNGIRLAIKRIVAQWYENREIGGIPLEAEATLVPFIRWLL